MVMNLTITLETDPEDSEQYLDIQPDIDGINTDVNYTRPPHLSTVVSVGGAAADQPDVPVDSVGDLEPKRRIKVNGVEYQISIVDAVTPKLTMTTNLAVALVGAEVVVTDNATLQSEVEADLTARGYTWIP